MLAALRLAAYELDMPKLTMICDPEAGKTELRFNDGKCDPAGRFLAGTMPVEAAGREIGERERAGR